MVIDPPERRSWVLLPGTLCTGAVFDGFLDALGVPTDAREDVELTHPNVEDYAEVLAKVPSDAIICGFSLGAIVTAHVADRLRASQIVLFGLNPHADDPAKHDGRLALARDVSERGGAAALAERLPALAGASPETARALVLSMADETSHLIEAHTKLALGRPGALEPLGQSQRPITFLTGTQDTQAPLRLAQEAAAAAPRGQVVALEGLGHYALVEDPAACAHALRDVWASE
ncbi:alpha/beta fold hydrolase [Gymnodinialimonas sp.]